MKFGVLGPLVAYDDEGRSVRLSGPARRLLLAALVARAGRTVGADTLIEDLWGQSPPATAPKTLQSHVLRLRAELRQARAAGDGVLVTDPTGYRLAVEPGAVDAAEFEQDLQRGRDSLAADRPAEAVALLDQAIARWRDDAYLEFAEAAFAVGERQRLAELRSLAREERTNAALRLGQDGELIAELEARVRVEPYRERGWEQLILALYRSGRQADALATYQRARARLVEDLGVDPGDALRSLEQRILAHDPDLTAGRLIPAVVVAARPTGVLANPYRGLARYEERDAGLFVARRRPVAEIAGRLAEHDLVVVTGASGVGKSSVVRAGLVPALRTGALPGSSAWRSTVLTPDHVLAHLSERPADLLVVDQAEELFTLYDRATRDDVAHALARYLGTSGRVVLVVRADFYGLIAELPGLGPRAGGATVLVGSPTETDLRVIVTEPARRVGLEVEPALVERVLDDVREQPGALPLLSAALVRTFDNRDGSTLTLAGYLAGGGVEGALEATAEEAYDALDDAGRSAARILLVRLAAREGGGWVRRPLPRREAERPDDPAGKGAVAALAHRRLLVIGADRVEVAHEALLTGWPRLHSWLEERSLSAELAEHLRTASLGWEGSGRPDADLYRGPRLQAALDWRDAHTADVSPLESQFLTAARDSADAELASAHRRADAEAHGRRRLRVVVGALAAAMVVMLVAGVVAVGERRTADAEALSADGARVAALSQTVPDLRTSLLLATAGYRLQDSAATRSGLLSSLERNGSALYELPTTNRLLALFASADGSRLLAMDDLRTVMVYAMPGHRVVATYPARAAALTALSPDGTRLVVEGQTSDQDPGGAGRVAVLDSADGSLVRVLPTVTSQFAADSTGVFTADGRSFAVIEAVPAATGRGFDAGRVGSAVDVYDTRNWAARPRTLQLPATVTALAAGGADLVVTAVDGTIEQVRAADLAVVARAERPSIADPGGDPLAPGALQLALSPDDRHVAIGGSLGVVVLASSQLGAIGSTGSRQTGAIDGIAFGPDSSRLAVVTDAGEVVLYAAVDARYEQNLVGHSGVVKAVTWGGTGTSTALYTAGLDSQIIAWDLTATPRLIHVSPGTVPLPQAFYVARFGDNMVGTSSEPPYGRSNTTLFDLDLRTGAVHTWGVGFTDVDAVSRVSASADGTRAVISYEDLGDSTFHFLVWNLRTGRRVGTFDPPAGADQSGFLGAVLTSDGTRAYETVSHDRVDLVSVPSGRVLDSAVLRFPGLPLADSQDDPLVVDPSGRLLVGGQQANPPPPPALGTGPVAAPPAASVLPPVLRLGVFDPTSGRLLGTASMGTAGISTWAYSQDGATIAFGTATGTVTVADAATLRPRPGADSIAASDGAVQSIDISPDGTMIVTGTEEGVLTLWDAASMRPVGNPVVTRGLAGMWAWFAASGDVLGVTTDPSTGSPDPAVAHTFTFVARPASWAQRACSLAGTDMSQQAWARYLGSRPYQTVCRPT